MNKRCERKILRSKLEINNSEIRKWWDDECKILDTIKSPLFQDNLDVFSEILPPRFYYRLLRVLKIRSKKESMTFEFENVKSTKESVDAGSTIFQSDRSTASSKEFVNVSERKIPTIDISSYAYMNFFKRRSDQAAVWHKPPPPSRAEMNLEQLADDIANTIANNFVDWLTSLECDEQTSLSVEGIKEMFSVESMKSVATTLKVILKEIASVPPKVAEARSLPQFDKRLMLHKEIEKDKRASRIERKAVAFGKCLPPDCQYIPPPKDISKKWMKCEKLPRKLETMATVWQGITHLRVTRCFCEYILNEKPDMKAPKYLVDSGMMKPGSSHTQSDGQLPNFENFDSSFQT